MPATVNSKSSRSARAQRQRRTASPTPSLGDRHRLGVGEKKPRRGGRPVEDLEWLRGRHSLSDLKERFPAEWVQVHQDVADVVARNDKEEIQAYIVAAARPAQNLPGSRVRPARERVRSEAQRQMAVHLLKHAIVRSSTGVSEGRIRFNLINGYVAQKLLFRRDLERKPVALWLFRLVWPMLAQRRLLMPLVQPEGIWCFYSSKLVSRLAELIGDRPCLEIAAGDGTLTRFLAEAGVKVTATDNYSWNDTITFPGAVLRQDARTALREHQPKVVICSWPPAGNDFERYVFSTPSVDLYVVISSTSEISTGNWTSYRQQQTFDMTRDATLSGMVLPPEVGHGVYIFKRRSMPAQGHQQGYQQEQQQQSRG